MSEFQFLPYIETLIRAAKLNPAPPLASLPVEEVRKVRNQVIGDLMGPPPQVAEVENRTIPGPGGDIPVRIYKPEGSDPKPGMVYFHGGGWVVGNLETHDSPCRALANGLSAVVVAVDYRLSPEHKFPAAAEDCYAATQWAAENAASLGIDPNRLVVAGDSAGGNLAAVVSLMARDAKDQGGPAIAHQLLIYPCLDLASFETPSYNDWAEAFVLTKETMTFFRDSYLATDVDGNSQLASPLLANDLRNLPPTLIITAQYDVLTAEAEVFAEKLAKAGVEARYIEFPGVIHLFYGMAGLSLEENGLQYTFDVLGTALNS